MAEEAFTCNIVDYLISRIHEEDTKFGLEYVSEKISITEQVLMNCGSLLSVEDFYEEECQGSILNWAYDLVCKSDFASEKAIKKNVEILLVNILKIFQVFPIKPMDLISLNFIHKLNKIKHSLKYTNLLLYQNFKQLILYWSNIIHLHLSQVSNQHFLAIKRKRNSSASDRDEEEENEEDDISSTSQSKTNLSSVDTKCSKKVTWLADDILVDCVDFDPNEEIIKPIEEMNEQECNC